MKNNTLYIIGNGFDLHHGLKTGYSDFRAYLEKEDTNLLYLLDSYFSVDLWSDFEKNLSELDIAEVFRSNEDLLPDDEIDRDGDKYVFIDKMEQLRNSLTIDLRNKMRNWILSLDYPTRIGDIDLGLTPNATFLSFNYSVTLERLYNINSGQITYIHNKAQWMDLRSVMPKERYIFEMAENFSAKYNPFWPKEAEIRNNILGDNSDIIIGHCVKDIKFKIPLATKKGVNALYSFEEGFDAIKLYDNYKNTEQIMYDNRQFFDNLATIENIIIIGHSLSDVDMPYFFELGRQTNNCKRYIITYYGKENRKKIKSQSAKFTNAGHEVVFVDLKDDTINIRQQISI